MLPKETAQEVAQEGVTITGSQVASQIDRGEWQYGAKDVVERLGDTALSSVPVFRCTERAGWRLQRCYGNRTSSPQQAQQATVAEQEPTPVETEIFCSFAGTTVLCTGSGHSSHFGGKRRNRNTRKPSGPGRGRPD